MSWKQRDVIVTNLWARHIPDKNRYDYTKAGRPIVVRRVFQKEKAPLWAYYHCQRCVDNSTVCRKHQFVLYGEDAVRHYVEAQIRCLSKVDRMSRILKEVTTATMNPEQTDEIYAAETADRADLGDEYMLEIRSIWWEFRRCRSEIFHRDTGIHLPLCCKFPRDNLYQAFRDHHTYKQ